MKYKTNSKSNIAANEKKEAERPVLNELGE
jgi:hypothetical protein